MHVYVYVYIYMNIHICMYIYISVHIYAYIYMHVHVCLRRAIIESNNLNSFLSRSRSRSPRDATSQDFIWYEDRCGHGAFTWQSTSLILGCKEKKRQKKFCGKKSPCHKWYFLFPVTTCEIVMKKKSHSGMRPFFLEKDDTCMSRVTQVLRSNDSSFFEGVFFVVEWVVFFWTRHDMTHEWVVLYTNELCCTSSMAHTCHRVLQCVAKRDDFMCWRSLFLNESFFFVQQDMTHMIHVTQVAWRTRAAVCCDALLHGFFLYSTFSFLHGSSFFCTRYDTRMS